MTRAPGWRPDVAKPGETPCAMCGVGRPAAPEQSNCYPCNWGLCCIYCHEPRRQHVTDQCLYDVTYFTLKN